MIQDIGNDPTQIDKVRIYSTAARQFFHTDAADIVGLLCLAKAQEGGESKSAHTGSTDALGDVVSAHQVWNTLQAERPDVARLLAEPVWYFDRKGEVSKGQNGWVKKAVRRSKPPDLTETDTFSCFTTMMERSFLPMTHISSSLVSRQAPAPRGPADFLPVTRHVEAGLIPGHTPAQLEAIQVLEEVAQRLSLHMVLAVGDIQFVADSKSRPVRRVA